MLATNWSQRRHSGGGIPSGHVSSALTSDVGKCWRKTLDDRMMRTPDFMVTKFGVDKTIRAAEDTLFHTDDSHLIDRLVIYFATSSISDSSSVPVWWHASWCSYLHCTLSCLSGFIVYTSLTIYFYGYYKYWLHGIFETGHKWLSRNEAAGVRNTRF